MGTKRCSAETIVEVSSPAGQGALISVTTSEDGSLIIEVYRADEGVTIRAGRCQSKMGSTEFTPA